MLDFVITLKVAASGRSRKARAELFNRTLHPTEHTLILDLGGGRGRHFGTYFSTLKNVVILDNNLEALKHAATVYGFATRHVDATERLPFDNHEFDIVFCSSLIEHVTGPRVEAIRRFKENGKLFRDEAWAYQKQLAAEIHRIGKSYFVQTPNRYFLIETHSWIPMLGYLPTHIQWHIIKSFNSFWPRRHSEPDWALLSLREMKILFPDAKIHRERFLFLFTKSLIAIKSSAAKDPDRRLA